MGNDLEVNSDAVNFPLQESIHNGYLEFENVDFACPTVVKHRLRENISFWQNIGASRWVLRVLQDGYSLPFISLPQEAFLKNHPSAVEDNVFVSTEISKLLLSGTVVEVKREDLVVCNPLGVVRNSAQKPCPIALVSSIECKYCLISTSYLAGLLDIFKLLHV